MLQIIHRCEEGGIKRISVKVKREEHLGGEKFWGEERNGEKCEKEEGKSQSWVWELLKSENQFCENSKFSILQRSRDTGME